MRPFVVLGVVAVAVAAVSWTGDSSIRLASADVAHQDVEGCVATEPRTASRSITWRVREGDSLLRIARSVYGDERLWTAIRDANLDRVGLHGEVRAGVYLTIPYRGI